MMVKSIGKLLPDEHVLWAGRPDWRALARDMLHVRLVALYFAIIWIWDAASDRVAHLTPMQILAAGAPLALTGLMIVLICSAFAWGLARTTTYTITNERCIIRFGIALTATLSLPLRKVSAVLVAPRPGGTGDLPMLFKSGKRLSFLKLWPHVRPWRIGQPQPMLRNVPNVSEVGTILSQAVAAVAAGRLHEPATTHRSKASLLTVKIPANG